MSFRSRLRERLLVDAPLILSGAVVEWLVDFRPDSVMRARSPWVIKVLLGSFLPISPLVLSFWILHYLPERWRTDRAVFFVPLPAGAAIVLLAEAYFRWLTGHF